MTAATAATRMWIEPCPHCGAEQKGLPPGVEPAQQRHCATGCGRYFNSNSVEKVG